MRWNSSKMRAVAGAMPTPVSSTSSHARSPRRRTPTSTRPVGIFDRVRDQVLRDPPQNTGSLSTTAEVGAKVSCPWPRPWGCVFHPRRLKQPRQFDRLALELDALAVQPGDVQNRMHQFLDRFKGAGQALGQLRSGTGPAAVSFSAARNSLAAKAAATGRGWRRAGTGLGAVRLFGGGCTASSRLRSDRSASARSKIAGAGLHLLFQRHGGLKHRPRPSRAFPQAGRRVRPAHR